MRVVFHWKLEKVNEFDPNQYKIIEAGSFHAGVFRPFCHLMATFDQLSPEAATMSSVQTLDKHAPAAAAARRPMRLREIVSEWAFILLAPVAAYSVFKMNLFNQATPGMVDPWLYTGYAQDPALLFDQFGWTYYGIRFPVIFLGHGFNEALGPMNGYIALRYVILVSVGALLFAWARRYFGLGIAVLSYLFLFCNPYFPRLLLWDWVQYLAIPLAFAGMLVWYLPTQRPSLHAAIVGFLFAAAIASHFFLISAIGIFMLVECQSLFRSQRPAAAARQLLSMALGGGVCIALGLAYMAIIYRSFDPIHVYTILYGAIKAGESYAVAYASGFLSWGTRIWYGYLPPVLVISAGMMLGREALKTSIEARVWQFACAYTAFYWFYQLVLGRFIIENLYYSFALTLTTYMLFPVWLALALRKLDSEQARRRSVTLLLAGAALVGAPLANRIWPSLYADILDSTQRSSLLLGFLAFFVACLTAALWRGAVRPRSALVLASLPLLVVCFQLMVFTNPDYRQPFSEGRSREIAFRRAALDLFSIYQTYTTPQKKIVNWSTPKELQIINITSVVLINNLGGFWDQEGLPVLGERQMAHLNAPNIRYVLAVSEDRERIEAGKNALKESGIRFEVTKRGTLGDGEYQPYFSLLEILR